MFILISEFLIYTTASRKFLSLGNFGLHTIDSTNFHLNQVKVVIPLDVLMQSSRGNLKEETDLSREKKEELRPRSQRIRRLPKILENFTLVSPPQIRRYRNSSTSFRNLPSKLTKDEKLRDKSELQKQDETKKIESNNALLVQVDGQKPVFRFGCSNSYGDPLNIHDPDFTYFPRRRRNVMTQQEYRRLLSSIIELPTPCDRPDDLSTYRGTPKNFQCPKCPKRFSARSSVVQHMRYDCNRAPRFACPYCEIQSKWPFSLYKHIRNVHPGLKVYCNDMSTDKYSSSGSVLGGCPEHVPLHEMLAQVPSLQQPLPSRTLRVREKAALRLLLLLLRYQAHEQRLRARQAHAHRPAARLQGRGRRQNLPQMNYQTLLCVELSQPQWLICPHCPRLLETDECLQRHLRSHDYSRVITHDPLGRAPPAIQHRCNYCEYTSKYTSNIHKHIYRISLPEDPSMPDPQLILFEPDTTPQIRNINSAPGRFPCGRCERSQFPRSSRRNSKFDVKSTSPEIIDMALKAVLGGLPLRTAELVYGVSKSTLQRRKKKVETNPQPIEGRRKSALKEEDVVVYLCPNCGKRYNYHSSLVRHIKHECGVEPKIHCSLCPYKTKHRSSLKSHVISKHTGFYNLLQ
uniref:C2H2-type domain-containing protein n=1 Tax=Trichogramma kaykai TaxID=54128 RepID=A0ABD2WTV9_9HYME